MRFYLVLFILLIISCKNEVNQTAKDDPISTEKNNNKNSSFEDLLIDVRDVKQSFVKGYGIESFGIKKEKNNFLFYVLKLNQNVTKEVINNYSIGAKAYNSQDPKNILTRSYSPNLKTIENEKYLFLKVPPTKWQYMDSIDFYIYARNNWKISGRIGSIKVRDILIEE